MNRAVQFVRSLFPTDPKQVLLIVGLVCLTVAPRLNWLPSDVRSFIADLSYMGHTPPEEIRRNWVTVVVMVTCPFIFAASAGFFTCCWPGKRPARRIFLLVVLPVFVGLCVVCTGYLSLLASASSPRSVLQRGPAFEHGPVWMISKLLNLGTAFHFCLVGLVLTVAFALLLVRGKTSLPISIGTQNTGTAEATDAWRGCKRLIWIFQGAAPLTAVPLNLTSLLLLLIPAGPAVPWQYQASQALTPTAEGLIFFAIAVWAMGNDNWKYIRQQIRLPTPSYAGLGLAIPAGPRCYRR